jgi:hypothetical protein
MSGSFSLLHVCLAAPASPHTVLTAALPPPPPLLLLLLLLPQVLEGVGGHCEASGPLDRL